ncbi:hypothetical protein AA23498_2095 [Acetobacter nitrogenifigens DSM 23921 = NBRC 105050]|nr:hypothetical protein AA23498_2095 [Acetobacter nitrogenifigens DSM 23921 = NBRC 105050]
MRELAVVETAHDFFKAKYIDGRFGPSVAFSVVPSAERGVVDLRVIILKYLGTEILYSRNSIVQMEAE